MFVISVKKAEVSAYSIVSLAFSYQSGMRPVYRMLPNKKSLSRQGKAFFVCGADGARTRDLLRDRQAL